MTAYVLAGLIGLGTMLMVIGALLVVRGVLVRREIARALETENATTPTPTAEGVTDHLAGPEPIRDVRTAKLRAEQIRNHTFEEVGHFQQTKPDSPERAWFLQGLTIRTSLNMAIMAFGVANLAIGMGVALLITGAAAIALGVPVVLRLDL